MQCISLRRRAKPLHLQSSKYFEILSIVWSTLSFWVCLSCTSSILCLQCVCCNLIIIGQSKNVFSFLSLRFLFVLPSSSISIGYRLRWRSDIWRTDRGVAEVRSPGIRPATEDDIRHNAPGLLETVDQLLRTKVRRKLLNQDKPSRLASYALQQHKAKSARLAASEFSFLDPCRFKTL